MVETGSVLPRSTQSRTASALSGVPSWNCTFPRRLKMTLSGSGISQLWARLRAGWGTLSLSYATRVS